MNESPDTKDSRAEKLKRAMHQLPYISAELPGIGGVIKAEPEHFQVQEILPYAACGEGEHVFVTLRRKLWNTADVAAELGRRFDLKSVDVGWGGRKDKQAVATQTFSLLLPMSLDIVEIRARLAALPFEILAMERHRNKLKTGHVAGNRFKILLSQVEPECLAQAQAIAQVLRQRGVPNFYGEQRFGMQMANIDRAMRMVTQQRPSRNKQDDLMVSALQSALFNIWLFERIARGQGFAIIPGDVAQKTDTNGLFVVQDMNDAAQRYAQGAILYTGPIYGPKMKMAEDQALEYENQVLKAFDLDLDTFKMLKAPGSRRPAFLTIPDLALEPVDSGLCFAFTLPAGAYATMVMREFMRPSEMAS